MNLLRSVSRNVYHRLQLRSITASVSTDLSGLLQEPVVKTKLNDILQRRDELTKQLSPEAKASPSSAGFHRELAKLEMTLCTSKEMTAVQCQMAEVRKMLSNSEEDVEMKAVAQEELETLMSKIQKLGNAFLSQLVPLDDMDEQDVIMEVRAGVGGAEGALFAGELMEMYKKYAQKQKWKVESMETNRSEQRGGIKFASLGISGAGVYGRLKVENGVHRVQRIPITEKAGRLQTSAASVAVLSQPEDVEFELNPDDLRIDVFRASGAGGQHVNTTESAVRITHLPTKLTVAIQDERSQHKNKAKALRVLRAKISDRMRMEKQKEQSEERMQIIGTGDRSGRVRTYHYSQDRVTDHRIQYSEFGVEEMLQGLKLDTFIDRLITYYRLRSLGSTAGDVKK